MIHIVKDVVRRLIGVNDMTNAEAIEYIKKNCYGEWCEDDWREAIDMAIEALKCSETPKSSERAAETAQDVQDGDLIFRKAAIEALARMMPRSYTPDGSHPADEEIFRAQEVFADCIEALEILPSAQPEPYWIPCSKRMPEEREWIGTKTFGTTISDEVYVTFESPKGERFTKHLSFQNGKVSSFTQREIDVFYKGAVPIAWMPLPEPYRGGDT